MLRCGNIPLVPVLIKKDVYNFGLLALRLCQSRIIYKDIAKYIAKHFFYKWVLLSDKVYYHGNIPEDTPNCAFERLKTETQVIMNNPGPRRLAEIAYAYAKAGKKVIYSRMVDMEGGLSLLGKKKMCPYRNCMVFDNNGWIMSNFNNESRLVPDLVISLKEEVDVQDVKKYRNSVFLSIQI